MSDVNDAVTYANAREEIGAICPECGQPYRTYFPSPACPRCLGQDLTPVPVEPRFIVEYYSPALRRKVRTGDYEQSFAIRFAAQMRGKLIPKEGV